MWVQTAEEEGEGGVVIGVIEVGAGCVAHAAAHSARATDVAQASAAQPGDQVLEAEWHRHRHRPRTVSTRSMARAAMIADAGVAHTRRRGRRRVGRHPARSRDAFDAHALVARFADKVEHLGRHQLLAARALDLSRRDGVRFRFASPTVARRRSCR